MANIQRRSRTAESISTTMRYTPETYERIRAYAFRENMSIGRANEELVLKGLEKAGPIKKAS